METFTVVFTVYGRLYTKTTQETFNSWFAASRKFWAQVENFEGYNSNGRKRNFQAVLFDPYGGAVASRNKQGTIWTDDICCFPVNA